MSHTGPAFERLEDRLLLSANLAAIFSQPRVALSPQLSANYVAVAYPTARLEAVSPSATSPLSGSLTPSQVRQAYGLDQVFFGSISGDGTGQTIAIIDAYDYPTALNDVQAFSSQFGLPLFNQPDGPTFARVAQDGSTNYPSTDPNGAGSSKGTWEEEEALDIQWAHSIAPNANIILVEANDSSFVNLVQNAVNWARSQPGVVAISMSFSGSEFSSETTYDSYFTTPASHAGVTFLAATGDSGVPSGYPAYSPNVVAVGGTTLTVNSSGWVSETGWSGSGGGISSYESQPAYQDLLVTQSSTKRTNPDIAMDANPNTGVAVYDSWDYPTSPWLQFGGTSLATPMWAGLIAVVDQGRALEGLSSLDGATQTLPALYTIPAGDFHDITSGNNGYAAAAGYDLVTGRGSPIGPLLICDLGGLGSISGKVYQDNSGDGVAEAAEPGLAGVTVFLDANNNGVPDPAGSGNYVSSNVPVSVPGNSTHTSTVTVSGAGGPITDVNVTFSITVNRDSVISAYLIGPDGTKITLFSGVGGSGANFSNITLSDQATASLPGSSAPTPNGTYKPSPGPLSVFNGMNANGTWTLQISNSSRSRTATLTAWSLAITTAAERTTVTDSGGNYTFSSVWAGSYNVRQAVPGNNVQTGPSPGATPAAANVISVGFAMTGKNFGDFPTIFTASGATDSFYIRQDPSQTYVQIFNATAPLLTPTYQVARSLLPSLTFNLLGTANTMTVDYSNGSPVPTGNLTIHNATGSSDALHVVGQSSSQGFTLTDTQIAPAGGAAVLFQNFASLWFQSCTVYYGGDLSAFQSLHVGSGATFVWG